PVDVEGRTVANGTHVVQIPDSGSTGNGVPIALGASLVLIYRDPRLPLNAVVLYDGGFTMDQSHESMSQTIKGFYQAAADPASGFTGRITHIVGSGQANKLENLRLPGIDNSTNASTISNPFLTPAGANWDNRTYDLHGVTVASSAQYGDSVTTSVDHTGLSTFDCLSWGAIVYRTAVVDTDGDGLLDRWEDSNPPLRDPDNHPLPNLKLMGAKKNHKDVFVEFGYMKTDAAATYGSSASAKTYPAHSHLPSIEALIAAGDAYKNGLVANPDGVNGIAAHFDVGNNYQGVSSYIIPYSSDPASNLARGGESIDESVTVTVPGGGACISPDCQFPAYPGTVGWKVGFKFYRDQLLRSSTST